MRSELPADGVERCPAWCAVNHEVVGEEFNDVVHESAHLPVAGVVPQRGHGSDGVPERQAVPTELYLVRYQYAGEADEWLYLGDGYHGLDVSPRDSAAVEVGDWPGDGHQSRASLSKRQRYLRSLLPQLGKVGFHQAEATVELAVVAVLGGEDTLVHRVAHAGFDNHLAVDP